MTRAEKKKLALAGGMLGVAGALLAWYSFARGSGRASPEALSAQEKVLEQIGAPAPTNEEAPPPGTKMEKGTAGKPRAVQPGK